MNIHEPKQLVSENVRKTRTNIVTVLCIIWVLASIIGFAVQAFAATPTVLRGAQSPSIPAPKAAPSRTKNPKQNTTTSQAWLGASVWRVGSCTSFQNFQTFSFTREPKVEVGNGKPGDGERLELLRASTDPTGLIQIETRVCAPVGCNQTMERYKKLGADQMQEWHFEGRLPDHVPYVIVANGAAVDGSGPGRVFNRCGA